MASHRTPRVVAARKLTTRKGRKRAGRFLAEGAQAAAEAVTYGRVHELFVTDAAAARHAEIVERATAAGIEVTRTDQRAAELLSETVTAQGIVAVCDLLDVPVGEALAGGPRMVAVLVGVTDPGNAGTVVRVADAAGADAVIFAEDAVDPHNGKCVRASTGSVFHLPLARAATMSEVAAVCGDAGLVLTATDGVRGRDITDLPELSGARAWLFGSEAHGLASEVVASADDIVRVPIYGHAESLNLGTAAAVCLYTAAMSARAGTGGEQPPRPGES